MRYLISIFIFIIFSLYFTSLLFSQSQVWTYDFGDEIGSFSSGDITNPGLLPDTQLGGGDTRLRIGDGNEIKLEIIGNDFGTFSRMILEGSPGTGQNTFAIGNGDFEPTEILYVRVTFRLSAVEDSENDFYLLIENENGFGSNGVFNSNNLGGVRFQITGNDVITHIRRNQGWATTGAFGSSVVTLDETFVIEIYFNNSNDQLTYYRNGLNFDLESGKYSVYKNGTRLAAVSSNDAEINSNLIEDDAKVSVIRFGGGTGDNGTQIEIDDIVYSNSLPDIRTIEGGEGWRMLALPHTTTVEQLARQNLVQGVTGTLFPSAPPNLYTSHTGTENDDDWSAPNSLSHTLNRGEGFIWYLYDNADVLDSKPLSFDLVNTGVQDDGDVTVGLVTENERWSLIGNPFSSDLDISGLNSWLNGGDLTSEVPQTWDHTIGANGNWRLLNDNKVAAFQGFYIQTTEGASEIEIPAAAQTNDATFYKANNSGLIAFTLNTVEDHTGRKYADEAINLYFSENADHNWDLRDAPKLTPMSDKYISMAFAGERDGNIILKAQDSRPLNLKESISIPVEFLSAGVNGSAELSVSRLKNIPVDWKLEIEDIHTGIRQELSQNQPFQFNMSSNVQVNKSEKNNSAPIPTTAKSTDNSTRYLMHLSPGIEHTSDAIPTQYTLNQNYPNPFNPTTVISYELPKPVNVQLEVFDILGRQISTLVDGQLDAGIHQVTFDASNLSNGIYIYRLNAGDNLLTKKLTVLK